MSERPPILPASLGLLAMLGVFISHFFQPITVLFPYPSNFLALLPICVGATLNILADRELQKAGAIERANEADAEPRVLVRSGVYRYSRNPAYLGLLLIIIGMAIWVGSGSPWLVVIAFAIVLSNIYVQKEEVMLLARFGRNYEQYQQTTPRWLGFTQQK